jgi:hypothetical protein
VASGIKVEYTECAMQDRTFDGSCWGVVWDF